MMRENQSDSEDGWPPPGEYISPWASREADKASPGGGEGGLGAGGRHVGHHCLRRAGQRTARSG